MKKDFDASERVLKLCNDVLAQDAEVSTHPRSWLVLYCLLSYSFLTNHLKKIHPDCVFPSVFLLYLCCSSYWEERRRMMPPRSKPSRYVLITRGNEIDRVCCWLLDGVNCVLTKKMIPPFHSQFSPSFFLSFVNCRRLLRCSRSSIQSVSRIGLTLETRYKIWNNRGEKPAMRYLNIVTSVNHK